ncbi:hypothetical protein [Delftia tsuruhatensis]|uniref:hypothetical protein n=1 Tax=Delftia tsuruhatensis TaxID=180282 RepID=UPI0012A900F0|nr:hypothetical protein [Delftia tsuruhatensis]QFS64815.1 hypothetical protein GCS91_11085 [Delftia tsuruhatensis]
MAHLFDFFDSFDFHGLPEIKTLKTPVIAMTCAMFFMRPIGPKESNRGKFSVRAEQGGLEGERL